MISFFHKGKFILQGLPSLILLIYVMKRNLFQRGYRMDYEIKDVKMEDEFKICPSCGYKDGFHSIFKKEGGITKWLFICPSCHEVFNIGFTV